MAYLGPVGINGGAPRKPLAAIPRTPRPRGSSRTRVFGRASSIAARGSGTHAAGVRSGMLRFLFDTDHLTLYQHKHPPLMRQIAARPAAELGISAITIEETFRERA